MIVNNFLFCADGAVYIPELKTNKYKYWMSKLAFSIGKCSNPSLGITVQCGKSFAVDQKENILYIPSDFSEPRQCYMLRVVVDYIEIYRQNLPLHAAVVSNDVKQVIIFAKSGSGKSYISQLICDSEAGWSIIGDDHLILNETCIHGNGYMRLRAHNDDKPHYIKNIGFDSRKAALTVCYEHNNTVNIRRELTSWDELSSLMMRLSAHKYLIDSFTMNDIIYHAEQMWGSEIVKKYSLLTKKFMAETKAIHIIGSHIYAVEQIRSLLSKKI